MIQENLPHLFLSNSYTQINYAPPQRPSSRLRIPQRNREQHSQKLRNQFENAWSRSKQNSLQRTAISLPAKTGVYLEFKSQANSDLVIKSLENLRFGIRLLNVREVRICDEEYTTATVYIPAGKEGYFLKKIQQYQIPKNGKYRNELLINSIEDVRLAVLESFWPEQERIYMPGNVSKWCEVWLRTEFRKDAQSIELRQQSKEVADFIILCRRLEIAFQEDFLIFPERAVILIKSDNSTLVNLIESSDNIAEFRLAKQTAEFWTTLSPSEQAEWVDDMQRRLKVNEQAKVAIAILDTGVNNGHILLSPILKDEDCHSHKIEWGIEDHAGHGTNMAGLAAYGDVQKQLEHSTIIEVPHKLESIKILPPHGENDPKHWGFITQQAISKTEIQAPQSTHIGCMAVTSSLETDRGRPSSWSAAIDEMTSGAIDDTQRLFIVSAGNCNSADFHNYPDSNATKVVENPGQSWNAITVGAYTIKDKITDPNFQDHEVVAPVGGLSPYSTTSLVWDVKKWPFKPDIVFEGGNLSKSPDGSIGNLEDLELLTTYHRVSERQFSTINGTSAATAQAAWMAAQLQVAYPQAWPETIRGLVIHSAEWTDAMIRQFGVDMSRKGDMARLLRTCGYGVPNFRNAIACTNNSLTLIAQEYTQPFDKKKGQYCAKDMHVHTLPWPTSVLHDLGETQVELRITLSYFIEPGPGEIGWKDRYRYASHALRFDLNAPDETEKEFRQRLNKAARDADGDYDSDMAPSSRSDRWMIGVQRRTLGSVHSDIWKNGTAADLASCNMIGVYPAIGWWRERHHLNKWNKRARYSLIVSIRTPRQDIDIYTPVAVQIGIPISI